MWGIATTRQTTGRPTNLSPWGVWIGGEELHNNHHAYPASARFSRRPWEFDLGWQVIRLLRAMGLAQVRDEASHAVDPVMAQANAGHPVKISDFLRDRHEWLARFHQAIDQHQATIERLRAQGFSSWRKFSHKYDRLDRLAARQRERLAALLTEPALARLQALEADLRAFWTVRGLANPTTLAQWAERAREVAQHVSLPHLADYARAISPPMEPTPAHA